MSKHQAATPVFRKRVKAYDELDWEALEARMRGGLSVEHLSADQKFVFDKVMTWFKFAKVSQGPKTPLLTLGGFAGTGKSTLTAVFARELETTYSFPAKPMRIAFCAYTGKAANVLRQKLRAEGIKANAIGHPHFGGTIHSLMYSPLVGAGGHVLDWRKREDVSEYDLIIVDEASMVDEQILADLSSFRVPILAVGDHGQLPPVKGIGTLMIDPMLRLEKIHRQAEDNPIIALSKFIRETGDVPETWNNTENVRFATFGELPGLLEPLYETEKPEDIAILTYTNKCRQNMNYQGRCMRNRRDMSSVPTKGDQVICLRNVKGTLFNGMRGILEDDPKEVNHWYRGKFYFPDDELEVEGDILRAQVGREKTFSSFDDIVTATGAHIGRWGDVGLLFDYGYSMTVHKSQGSQFKHVFLVYERPYGIDAEDFRRWLYTGVTRSSQNLTIVVG